MADILIRGMEMPKDGHVIVRIYANGDVCEPTPCPGVWGKVARVTPLPEGHGRLGDLDALLEQIRDGFEKAEKWMDVVENDPEIRPRAEATVVAFWECGAKVKMAPAIVPAEGGVKVEKNICFTCKHFSEYPECPAVNDDVVFASNGDTIVHCKAYEETEGGGEDA